MNCPNCGNELKDNQKFCTNCRAKLSWEDKSNETKNQLNEPKKTKFILLILPLI